MYSWFVVGGGVVVVGFGVSLRIGVSLHNGIRCQVFEIPKYFAGISVQTCRQALAIQVTQSLLTRMSKCKAKDYLMEWGLGGAGGGAIGEKQTRNKCCCLYVFVLTTSG